MVALALDAQGCAGGDIRVTKPKPKVAAAEFLPTTRAEMDERGWDALDVLLITGDAYVDHPAFGVALLGRRLEAAGYRVGIVAQPRWHTQADVERMGRPKLFAGITAGSLDSMLAHYTAFKKPRHDDAYTPGGRHGARPNRATLVYTTLVRQAFPGLPVIIGGIEASLRRATHYDFWSDKIRRPILIDSQADLLAYGMAESALVEAARRLAGNLPLFGIPGTAWCLSGNIEFFPRPRLSDALSEAVAKSESAIQNPKSKTQNHFALPPRDSEVVRLASHEEIEADPKKLMESTLALERQVHEGLWAFQTCSSRSVVFAPPAPPLTTEELDAVYALPFTRRPHPSYRETIPAMEMIQFSVTTHRGCGGGCSFCSLALHQGRRIASRSAKSIVAEARSFAGHPDFRGVITDVGGPSANMWRASCAGDSRRCKRVSCLFPAICPSFQDDQASIVELLREIESLPHVKSMRVASGVRHDLAMRSEEFARALIGEFTGGQLKLAPEHSCDRVLKLMRKPSFKAFEQFLTIFERESKRAGKEQYVVPYLISAFPGTTDPDMHKLAGWLKSRGWRPQQVQCFIPTPGTVATAMFYAGIDPEGRPIPVARTDRDRYRQHRILKPDVGRPG